MQDEPITTTATTRPGEPTPDARRSTRDDALRDRRVLVTGGAAGLGAAVVHAVRRAGGAPLVLDRRPPSREVAHVRVDLADTAAAARAAAELIGELPLHGVVACAGVDVPGPLEGVSREDWERVVQVNLFATAAVLRSCLPALRASHGRVVTVASTLGHGAVGDATAYCASKFGVVGMTRALMVELRGEVGVTLLTPGGMATSFFDGRTEQYRPGPDARLADPAHVADAVLYALSRPASVELRELVVACPEEPTWP